MKKELLILKASNDICDEEIQHIQATAAMHKMGITIVEVFNYGQLEQELKKTNKKFDYIYLCANANHEVFGESDPYGYQMSWFDFGTTICSVECINYGCIFLLAGCRTGLNQVAYDLFQSCVQIEFVCGPRWKLKPNDLTVAFDVFVYNIDDRREQPDVAAERMSSAVGYKFEFYDRVEVELRPDYIRRVELIEQRLKERWAKEEELDFQEAHEVSVNAHSEQNLAELSH